MKKRPSNIFEQGFDALKSLLSPSASKADQNSNNTSASPTQMVVTEAAKESPEEGRFKVT